MSLIVSAATYRYPGAPRPAVDGAGFTLERGRVIALVGANGAGKSTLLAIAAGRMRPETGEATADGQNLSRLPPRVLARTIASLPQSERVPFDFSCLEFALFGTAAHVNPFAFPGEAEIEKARRALGVLGVGYLEERPVTGISLGELQLVRIARCVVQDAPWMLLDEPTAMLDPCHARAVGSAIRSLAEAGRGIFFSTHDIAFAASVADGALSLKAGRVIASGAASEVLVPAVLEETFGVPFEMRSVPAAAR